MHSVTDRQTDRQH